VALEEPLIHRHRLEADRTLERTHLDHPVDQQERIAMRDHPHDRVDVGVSQLGPGGESLLSH
jgi:hypothetical protein